MKKRTAMVAPPMGRLILIISISIHHSRHAHAEVGGGATRNTSATRRYP